LFELRALSSGRFGVPYRFRDCTEGFSAFSFPNRYAFQLLRLPSRSKEMLTVEAVHLFILHDSLLPVQTVVTAKVTLGRLQLKPDGTRWRTGGDVKGKLANGVGSQYPSHYFGTWCIQHYYRWCAHLGCQ